MSSTLKIKADETEIEIDKERFSFPPRFKKFRKSQYEAAEVINDLHKSGVQVVVLEASVGFGKTVCAELVRQMRSEWVPKSKMIYVAPTNGLITQMLESFPYANEIKGRLNYPHGGSTGKIDFANGSKNCGDCVKGKLCNQSSCEYKAAKYAFNSAEKIGITNTSYYILAANYLRAFNPLAKIKEPPPEAKKRPHCWQGGNFLTVFDEADEIESSLLGFFEVVIYPKFLQEVIERARLHNIKVPKAPVQDFKDCTVWFSWLIDVQDLIEKALTRYQNVDPDDVITNRWVIRLQKLLMGLSMVQPDWIYDPERAKNAQGYRNGAAEKVTLKPMLVGELGKEKFWDHTGDVVCMSGSIGSMEVFAKETGLDKSGKSCQFIRYENKWSKWNRTIHRVPGFNVVKKPTEKWENLEWWDKFIGEIAWILFKYPDERTLIHSVSHEMGQALGNSLGNIFGSRILISTAQNEKIKAPSLYEDLFPILSIETDGAESKKRDSALEAYLAEEGKVLIGASFLRGHDFYGNRCRNIIFPKIPWESMGDRRISALMETQEGRLWYLVQAVRKFTQGAGRGTRFNEDWCRIWVMDEQVDRLIELRGIMNDYLLESFRKPGDYVSKF
jgi:hypothetical protein